MHKINARIAPFLAHLSVMSTRDMFSILRDGGLENYEADGLVEAAVEELRRPECCALLKMYGVYAVKQIAD
jgi:hypothetical protein